MARGLDAMTHWREKQNKRKKKINEVTFSCLTNEEKEYMLLSVLCSSACHVRIAKEKMHVSS